MTEVNFEAVKIRDIEFVHMELESAEEPEASYSYNHQSWGHMITFEDGTKKGPFFSYDQAKDAIGFEWNECAYGPRGEDDWTIMDYDFHHGIWFYANYQEPGELGKVLPLYLVGLDSALYDLSFLGWTEVEEEDDDEDDD